MSFPTRDPVVENVAPTTLDPPLPYTVLPRTLQGCSDRTQAQGADGEANFKTVLGIAVKDSERRSQLEGEGFAQLLKDPGSRRMARDMEVQDPSAILADDKETGEDAEGDRWHREEIHRCNRFPMISQRGEPRRGGLKISRRSLPPTGDGSLGRFKPEHQEFAVDAGVRPMSDSRRPFGNSGGELVRNAFSPTRSVHHRDSAPIQPDLTAPHSLG
jgi:hypothetical protein